jgi:hypothetical protein
VAPLLTGTRFGEALGDRGGGAGRGLAAGGERDENRSAVDLRVVAHRARKLEHHARAVSGLHDVDAAQIAFRDLLHVASHRVARIREVERDPRRIGYGETGGRIGGRLLERHAHQHTPARLRRHVHRFDGVRLRLRMREREQQRKHRQRV